MKNPRQSKTGTDYYHQDKSIIANCIPPGQHTIFDIGCAAGVLGKNLRANEKVSTLIGAEIFKEAAQDALCFYDSVHIGDIETLDLDYDNYFDFVICGDIIEHLRDPDKLLMNIHRWLKKEGTLIVSIPNIRFWRVLIDLVLRGLWEYQDAGILDRTHLRFFTRRSFCVTLEKAGFKICASPMTIHGTKKNTFNFLTGKIFEEFLGSQILFIAKKKLDLINRKATLYKS